MPLQEAILRDLVACGACPALSRAAAVAAPAAGGEQRVGADLSFGQLLAALRGLPITAYSGSVAASYEGLLAAMRASSSGQEALAAELCGQVPLLWGMTSGTTGASKHFPVTPASRARMIGVVDRVNGLLLAKFPLNGGGSSGAGPAAAGADAGVAKGGGGNDGQAGGSGGGAAAAPAAAGGDGDDRDGTTGPARHRVLSMALTSACEELPGGQLVGSMSSVYYNAASRAGQPLNVDAAGRDMAACPARLAWAMAPAGAAAKYYALWLCGAADPGLARVTLLSDLFAGNLLTALHVLQHAWRDLAADLEAGKVRSSHAAGLPPAAVELVEGWLAAVGPAARGAHAAHIRAVMAAQHGAVAAGGAPPPLLGELLPHLHAVTVVVTGTHAKYWPELSRLLPRSRVVPVVTTMYAGTEGVYGLCEQLLREGPWDTSQHPTEQRFVLIPDGSCVFEFLEAAAPPAGGGGTSGDEPGPVPPDGTADDGGGGGGGCAHAQQGSAPCTLDEVRVGHTYELLVTTFAGLCRFAVGDMVRVEGHVTFDPAAVRITSGGVAASSCCCCCCCCDGSSKEGGAGGARAAGGGAVEQPKCGLPRLQRLPLVSFQGRVGMALNLIWEKFDEAQLLKALRETERALLQAAGTAGGKGGALLPQHGTSAHLRCFPGLAEYAVCECHGGSGSSKHYAFFWELREQQEDGEQEEDGERQQEQLQHAGGTPAAADAAGAGGAAAAAARHWHRSATPGPGDVAAWAAVLNEQLAAHNGVYGGLLRAGQIGAARIALVAPGTFGALRERLVAARRISPSQFKMPTVVAAGGTHERFLRERVLALAPAGEGLA